MYISEETHRVKINQTEEIETHLYLGKLLAQGIENWDRGDFWSINTQDDMFGSYLAEFGAEKLPLYPSNQTEVKWSRSDFGLVSIAPVNEGKSR